MRHREEQASADRSGPGDAEASTLSLTVGDLHDVERVITLRLAGDRQEGQRAARMRTLVRVSTELTRTLSTYSRHALVHCQGTAGASDLSDDTRRLVAALEAFCVEIRAVAMEYEAYLATPAS